MIQLELAIHTGPGPLLRAVLIHLSWQVAALLLLSLL